MCLAIFASKTNLWVFSVSVKWVTRLFFPSSIWKFLDLITQHTWSGLCNVFMANSHQILHHVLWLELRSVRILYWLTSFQHFVMSPGIPTQAAQSFKLCTYFTFIIHQAAKNCLKTAVSHLFYIPLVSLSFSISFYTNFKLTCLNFKQEAVIDWLILSLVMNKILSQKMQSQEFKHHLQVFSPFPVLLFLQCYRGSRLGERPPCCQDVFFEAHSRTTWRQ